MAQINNGNALCLLFRVLFSPPPRVCWKQRVRRCSIRWFANVWGKRTKWVSQDVKIKTQSVRWSGDKQNIETSTMHSNMSKHIHRELDGERKRHMFSILMTHDASILACLTCHSLFTFTSTTTTTEEEKKNNTKLEAQKSTHQVNSFSAESEQRWRYPNGFSKIMGKFVIFVNSSRTLPYLHFIFVSTAEYVFAYIFRYAFEFRGECGHIFLRPTFLR